MIACLNLAGIQRPSIMLQHLRPVKTSSSILTQWNTDVMMVIRLMALHPVRRPSSWHARPTVILPPRRLATL
jgi:hypothetical protein